MKQEQRYQLDDGSQHNLARSPEDGENQQKVEEMFPGIPIVRGNTPRPLSFQTMISSNGQFERLARSESFPAFPDQAPQAPPLPEEPDEHEEDAVIAPPDSVLSPELSDAIPLSQQTDFAEYDFILLFEYGLEMDTDILNSPERLHGLALPYGTGVLSGYKIKFGAQYIRGSTGPTIVAIEPCADADAQVWGVLYSIPRSLSEPNGTEPSLLDTIHAAIPPQSFFEGVQVIIREIQHDRDVTSLVYVATETAHQQLRLVPVEQWSGDSPFAQRLASIARKQELPEQAIHQYEALSSLPLQSEDSEELLPAAASANGAISAIPARTAQQNTELFPSASARTHQQNTEPVPAALPGPGAYQRNMEPPSTPGERSLLTKNDVQHSFSSQIDSSTNRWLVIFSLYLVCLLLIALTFAALESMRPDYELVNRQFAPLGVPWLVLMYGLLGGCVSCIVTLGRFRATSTPIFIIISWFTRPFVGAMLAVLAYLLLICGIFSFSGNANDQHLPLFLLAGAVAGFGESRVFFIKHYQYP
jgi:hypothetical protein